MHIHSYVHFDMFDTISMNFSLFLLYKHHVDVNIQYLFMRINDMIQINHVICLIDIYFNDF